MKSLVMIMSVAAALVVPALRARAANEDLATAAVKILSSKCADCHDEDGSSGLSLISREGALRGGKKGLKVVPGDVAASGLLKAVGREIKPAMPPDDPLTAAEVGLLSRWVQAGAPWTATTGEPSGPRWWAFKKPERPTVPPSTNRWIKTPIDAFIWQTLQAKGLTPAPEADRRTLIRRATFDLWGLAPSAAEVQAFEADRDPQAYEHLIDRLLASPHYGEQWGRHWLDLVRYGDTAGFEHDPFILYAWRYRDYVIDSFNEDKPYDIFVKEQIAGDEIWPDNPKAQVGTGFFTVGPNRDMQFKVEDTNKVETMTDYVDTTGGVFLGLTVGCARCHDHKFDPISQKDYYRLAAVFAPAVKSRIFLDYNKVRFADINDNYRQVRLQAIAQEIQLATARKDDAALAKIKDRLLKMFSGYAQPPVAMGITDMGREAPMTYVPTRSKGALGTAVKAGFPRALGGGDIPEPAREATSTTRRKALAEWLANPHNPLTARVIVNRIWQNHFGQGLVSTVSDFGTRSTPPSHPQLLDWLATEFVARGWSWKPLHRLIMTSSAYRQSAVGNARSRQIDPDNRWLAHTNRHRLTAEEIHDSLLQAAGELNEKRGGPPVSPPLAAEELFGISGGVDSWIVTPDPAEHRRRSIYLLSRRTFPMPMMEVFDSPDGMLTCPRRESSTTAPQALTLLNGEFTLEQSRHLADRLLHGTTRESRSLVDAAYRQVLGRSPSAQERGELATFVDQQTRRTGSQGRAVVELGRVLFNLNEFLYVE